MKYVVYNESYGGYKYVSSVDGNDSYAPIVHEKTLIFDDSDSASKWLNDADDIIVELPKEESE